MKIINFGDREIKLLLIVAALAIFGGIISLFPIKKPMEYIGLGIVSCLLLVVFILIIVIWRDLK